MSDFLSYQSVSFKPYLPLDKDSNMQDVAKVTQADDTWMELEAYIDMTHRDWVEGDYESFSSKLECVEEWAYDNGYIHDEDAANEAFEDYLVETMQPLELIYMIDHTTDLNTYFSDWIDNQVRDHRLHEEQGKNYSLCVDEDVLKHKASNKRSN